MESETLGILEVKALAPPSRAVIAIIAAVFLVSACSNSQNQQTSTNKTLIAETAFSVDSFDPGRAASPTTITVTHAVYDTLLVINPRDLSKPYPSLATSYTASSDGKTFTFQLRHDVKFQNGDPLTSADVVWSLTRDKNLQGASGTASFIMTGLTASAPDSYTVVITADPADPAVPVKVTSNNMGVLDSKLVQQNGGTTDQKDQAESYLNTVSAGSGPYMFQTVDRTSQVVLKANPKYWGQKPAYSTVILRNAPPNTQRLDVQDGQSQLAIDISALDASSLNSSSITIFAAASDDQTYLAMNNNAAVSPWTANPDFRDAVRYAIDYNGVVALAGKGSIQSSGFVPIGILGSLPASDAVHQDLARAKADIAKVGGSNPTVTLDYFNDFCTDGLCAQVFATKIQSDLKAIGVTVNLNGAPLSTLYSNKIAIGKSQMWLTVANPADYPDPSDFLGTSPGNYQAKFFGWPMGMDPTVDSQLQAATSAIAAKDRASAYQALARSINDKEVFVYIFIAGKALVTAKSVKAIMNPYWGVDFQLVT